MEPLILGIHHVALRCGSLERFQKSIAFYRDVLGLTVVRTWGTENNSAAMVSAGNALLEIFANGDPDQKGAIQHFAFHTNQVDDCIAAVREAGYLVTVEPKDITISSQPPFPARVAFCVGPAGELIEFFGERT